MRNVSLEMSEAMVAKPCLLCLWHFLIIILKNYQVGRFGCGVTRGWRDDQVESARGLAERNNGAFVVAHY